MHEYRSLGLRRERDGDARQIGREAGPGLRLDRRDGATEILLDDEAILRLHDEILAGHLGIDAEALEHHARHA